MPLRLALANLRFPTSREESVSLTTQAIEQAAAAGARIVCFPECFVPAYRAPCKASTGRLLGRGECDERMRSRVARVMARLSPTAATLPSARDAHRRAARREPAG